MKSLDLAVMREAVRRAVDRGVVAAVEPDDVMSLYTIEGRRQLGTEQRPPVLASVSRRKRARVGPDPRRGSTREGRCRGQ